MIKASWGFCFGLFFMCATAFADNYYVSEIESTSVDQQVKESVYDYIRMIKTWLMKNPRRILFLKQT